MGYFPFASTGGGGGSVSEVTGGDLSVIAANPTGPTVTLETGTFDVLASLHPAAAAVTFSNQKAVNLTNGSGAQDGAAFGQTLAGGDLAPLTTAGDLLIANATPAPARLAIGAALEGLFVVGGLPAWGLAIAQLATTGAAGFALQNATPNILTWTAPSDGNMHRVFCFSQMHVTSADTGGTVRAVSIYPDGYSSTFTLFSTNQGVGGYQNTTSFLIESGSTININQTVALSGGAATVWSELWGS